MSLNKTIVGVPRAKVHLQSNHLDVSLTYVFIELQRTDRLTTLPPELLGHIYDLVWTPDDDHRSHKFLPTAAALLDFQRGNLYRWPHFYSNAHMIPKFCKTIIGTNSLGTMIRHLTLDIDDEDFLSMELDQGMGLMFHQLTHLEYLLLGGDEIARLAFTSFEEQPAPSTLTTLELRAARESTIDDILRLFPSLQHLYIDKSDDPQYTRSTIARITPNSPRRLATLTIDADFQSQSQAICHLIASRSQQKHS
jgi:hypothetical protein